ncbi:hypothetical protein FOCC_FOCC000922 [Frankliniella occidentalis]|nr:hypothetical protein FOCC_FOCC000922 [Frankliniella occidentalis]
MVYSDKIEVRAKHPAIEPAHEEELTDSALRLQTARSPLEAPVSSRASLNALMPQPNVNASTSVVVNLPSTASELEQQPAPSAGTSADPQHQVRISSL